MHLARRRSDREGCTAYLRAENDFLPPEGVRKVRAPLGWVPFQLSTFDVPVRLGCANTQLRGVVVCRLLWRERRSCRGALRNGSVVEVGHGRNEGRECPWLRTGGKVLLERRVDEAMYTHTGVRTLGKCTQGAGSPGTHFMNLSAALNPHGNLSGLSKTFPNSRSSALYSFKNRPAQSAAQPPWPRWTSPDPAARTETYLGPGCSR